MRRFFLFFLFFIGFSCSAADKTSYLVEAVEGLKQMLFDMKSDDLDSFKSVGKKAGLFLTEEQKMEVQDDIDVMFVYAYKNGFSCIASFLHELASLESLKGFARFQKETEKKSFLVRTKKIYSNSYYKRPSNGKIEQESRPSIFD